MTHWYKFYKDESGKWFIHLPEWEGDIAELEMVCGADTMLDIFAQGEDEVYLTLSDKKVITVKFPRAILTNPVFQKDNGGSEYKCETWIGVEMQV